jgi:hypothetical protein
MAAFFATFPEGVIMMRLLTAARLGVVLAAVLVLAGLARPAMAQPTGCPALSVAPCVTVTNTGFANFDVSTASSASTAGIAPSATSAAASNLVLKASAGNVYGATVTTSTTPGYLMIFNATSAPGDGAVTPAKCVYIGWAPATMSISWRPGPGLYLGTGATLVFSTTGCYTKTASATAFLDGDVQ